MKIDHFLIVKKKTKLKIYVRFSRRLWKFLAVCPKVSERQHRKTFFSCFEFSKLCKLIVFQLFLKNCKPPFPIVFFLSSFSATAKVFGSTFKKFLTRGLQSNEKNKTGFGKTTKKMCCFIIVQNNGFFFNRQTCVVILYFSFCFQMLSCLEGFF